MKTLLAMLKDGLIHLPMMRMMQDRFQQARTKKKLFFFKDELGGKIMKKIAGLRAKTLAYLMDDGSEKKKAKETKNCLIKRRLQFEN